MHDHSPKLPADTMQRILTELQRYPSNVPDEPAEEYERRANARTILEIPRDQLPWDNAREAMVGYAMLGHDIYAYTHHNPTRYVIWHRRKDPAVESRFTPWAWARLYGYITDDEPKPAIQPGERLTREGA